MIIIFIILISLSAICFLYLFFLTAVHFVNSSWKNKKLRSRTFATASTLMMLLMLIYIITGCEAAILVYIIFVLGFGTVVYGFFNEYINSKDGGK